MTNKSNTVPEVAKPVKSDAIPEVAKPSAYSLTVAEFCARLSSRDPRVELVSAFHADEVRRGVMKDEEEKFQARFEAFCIRPVK